MWPRAIVTDLDGTLVDTLPDIAAALNLTLEGAGAQAIDERDVRYLIGGGARALVGKGFAARDVQLGDDETE
ncbi:MAG: HAD hydrolase-like protein, partial [Pseudomonadota bacterium]